MGGLARARRLAPARRQQIARRAAHARWKKIDPREVLKGGASLAEVCRRHGIVKLHAFGSVLTTAFSSDSDVDLLYERPRPFGYGEYCDAVDDLKALLGRDVDLVNMDVVVRSQNPFRRREILETARQLYDAST
jgi:predicted nucleotidyltransferase